MKISRAIVTFGWQKQGKDKNFLKHCRIWMTELRKLREFRKFPVDKSVVLIYYIVVKRGSSGKSEMVSHGARFSEVAEGRNAVTHPGTSGKTRG